MRSSPLVVLAAAALLAIALLLVGYAPGHASIAFAAPVAESTPGAKSSPRSGGVMGSSGRTGPFEAFSSRQRRPTVRVANLSYLPLRFVLRDSRGRESSMDVDPFSENVMEAQVGHFDAEILNPDGLVGSEAGDATFEQFHEYRASFGIGPVGGGGFHIGD